MKSIQKQITSKQQMTCKQISELVSVRHDSVKRSILRLADAGAISYPPMVDGRRSANGVVPTYYVFSGDQGERDSIIVIAQLSPKATAKLVDQWLALKEEVARLKAHLQDRTDARLQAPEMAFALKDSRESAGKDTPSHIYSNDYDMINVIVLGKKAKAYKLDQGLPANADLRDCMTAQEIRAVKTLQEMNTTLIKIGLDYQDRKARLNDYFMRSLNSMLVLEVMESL